MKNYEKCEILTLINSYMKKIKLSEWASQNSYSYRGAYNVFKRGDIKGEQLPSGTILIHCESENQQQSEDYTVVYARVSSSENKSNLETQAKRVADFCTANGWIINEIVKECGSGMNDSRPKLQNILHNPKVTRIVIEHKDRLTRFGFEYIKTLFPGEIVVINNVTENEQDLMQDFVSIITSFCARIYGKRRSKRVTDKIIKGISDDTIN